METSLWKASYTSEDSTILIPTWFLRSSQSLRHIQPYTNDLNPWDIWSPSCEAIKRLYTNLKVILKIGKEKAEISQKLGVRQGDPAIFLFIMAAFAETWGAEWSAAGIPMSELRRVPMGTTKELAKGQITGHKKATWIRENYSKYSKSYMSTTEPSFSIREKIWSKDSD